MTFHSINRAVDKKKEGIIKSEEQSSKIRLVFDKFLDQKFLEYRDLFKGSVSYSPKDGKVVIDTGSKVIASELSLKAKELSRLFKEENILVTQVVIL